MHDLTILTPTYTELVRGTLDGTYSEMILRQTFCVFQTQKKLRRKQNYISVSNGPWYEWSTHSTNSLWYE